MPQQFHRGLLFAKCCEQVSRSHLMWTKLKTTSSSRKRCSHTSTVPGNYFNMVFSFHNQRPWMQFLWHKQTCSFKLISMQITKSCFLEKGFFFFFRQQRSEDRRIQGAEMEFISRGFVQAREVQGGLWKGIMWNS